MRAERLISLLLLLQSRGCMTAQSLAQYLEVSERTVYRDIAALGQAGIPVYTRGGPGGGCALIEGYRTMLTGLTDSELFALFPSRDPGPLQAMGLSDALRSALLKLKSALPKELRPQANEISQRIHLDTTGWFHASEPTPFLSVLQQALWSGCQVLIHYRRATQEMFEAKVDPYGLVAKAAVWYLVGKVGPKLHVFRVSRVHATQVTNDPSQRPEAFDLTTFWSEWRSEFEASFEAHP